MSSAICYRPSHARSQKCTARVSGVVHRSTRAACLAACAAADSSEEEDKDDEESANEDGEDHAAALLGTG